MKRVRGPQIAALWYVAAAIWLIAFLIGVVSDRTSSSAYMLGLAGAFVAIGVAFQTQGRDGR